MITAFDANDSFGRWSSVATVVGSSGLVSGAGERKTPRPRRKYLVFAGALREGLWLRPCLGHVWRCRLNWVLMLKWSLNQSSTLFLCGSRSSMFVFFCTPISMIWHRNGRTCTRVMHRMDFAAVHRPRVSDRQSGTPLVRADCVTCVVWNST